MNKSPQYNQQSEPDQCKTEAEEMYSPKPRNWLSISLNTGAMLNNTSEESIYVNVAKLSSYMEQ